MNLNKKISGKKSLVALVIIVASGFLFPVVISLPHMMTERGKVERDMMAPLVEDWRLFNPCFPYRYIDNETAMFPSCPAGEDEVVVISICWFGMPGPQMRLCYENEESLELGTGKFKEITR